VTTKLRAISDKLQISRPMRIGLTLLFLVPYVLYIGFAISNDQGPIDYETFMRIGAAFNQGGEVYGENSYYPLPYAMLFGLFSSLPRPLSMVVWLGAPVLAALLAAGFHPYVLLFAPTFSHFLGGQSAVFGLLGFWGYRRNLEPASWQGGVLLALTTLKPQLGIIVIAYAAYQWAQSFRERRKVPRQLWAFLLTVLIIYLPAFLINPGWVGEWLRAPRPLFGRALSGAVPRLLLFIQAPNTTAYWVIWFLLAAVILVIVWRLKGSSHKLDILMLWGFIVNPLVHDYDLIQVIPTIWGPWMKVAAVALSIPGWWTILTSYANDAAWVTFVIIAPGLLIAYIAQCKFGLRDREDTRMSRCNQAPGSGD
jgi:hypothetical protein